MNIALIIAAGSGTRMGQDIPKQFINIYDKPIIIYTLESFQQHPEIDKIFVVCLSGWHDILRAYAKQFSITKLTEIFDGGSSAQESIYNGVIELKSYCQENDILIIHDGIRPLVETSVLSDVIRVCKSKGNAVTSLPYNEQIFKIKDDFSTTEYIPRDTLRRVSTPQAYKYEKLLNLYLKAKENNIGFSKSSYTNTMMCDLGETLYFAAGSEKNIKLTTKDDLELFKAYLKLDRNDWLK